MNKEFTTLDVYIASWIYLTTGIYPELRSHNGKVSFHFPLNEKVIQALSDYNSGGTIEASKYVQIIKNLKGLIFQAKEG